MSPALEVGQLVKVTAPGRRAFEATILAVRVDAVDVRDPRNGGLRTIATDRLETVRPTCEACGREVPAGHRRSRNAAGQLACSECRP